MPQMGGADALAPRRRRRTPRLPGVIPVGRPILFRHGPFPGQRHGKPPKVMGAGDWIRGARDGSRGKKGRRRPAA